MVVSRPAGLAFSLLLAGGLACSDGTAPNGGNGSDGGGNGGTGGGTPSLTGDVQPILSANCALSGCHGGSSPQLGMNLGPGQTFSNTVNVASVESSLDRIEPGQPDQSYLVHKIQGTQSQVGGTGGRMPLGGTPLSQADIDKIRAWITAGAQNN
jgi:hypothetical protein